MNFLLLKFEFHQNLANMHACINIGTHVKSLYSLYYTVRSLAIMYVAIHCHAVPYKTNTDSLAITL